MNETLARQILAEVLARRYGENDKVVMLARSGDLSEVDLIGLDAIAAMIRVAASAVEGVGETQPNEPGAFVGDIWYGDPVKRSLGTHRWDGDKWLPLPDEIESVLALLATARAEIERLKSSNTRAETVEECARVAELLDKQCCGDIDDDRGGCCGRWVDGTGEIAPAIRALSQTKGEKT